MTALRVEGVGRTDTGRVRSHNEDSLLCRPEIGLWCVADGMGGHEHGEWASAQIVSALQAVPRKHGFDDQLDEVIETVHAANGLIFAEATARGLQMGSTVVALLASAGRFAVVWAGDSRAYLLRDGMLHRLSTDHTQVQDMVDRGLLSAVEAEHHPMGHILARAIGVGETVSLDAIIDTTEPGDRFLLCSDGLTGVVADTELEARLAAGTLAELSESLIELCLARGAPDNVTVALVDIREATILTFGTAEGQSNGG